MGTAGTDTAIETADIALMGDDLSKLPYLYSLSHTAHGVIRQNIWSSLGVKFLLGLGCRCTSASPSRWSSAMWG